MREAVVDLGAQPVKNLVQGFAQVSTASTSGYGTAPTPVNVAAGLDGPLGGKAYRRWTTVAAFQPAANLDLHGFQPQNFGVSTLGAACPVVVGRPYSVAWPVRSSVAQKVHLQAQMISATGGAQGSKIGPDFTLVPNEWTLLTVENCIPGADAVSLRPDIDAGVAPIAWAIGNTMDVGRPYVFEGKTLPAGLMCDGDAPGWRWLGAAGTSESVGYPYTLESIVGKPHIENLVPNTFVDGADVSPFEGRTLYGVFDVFDFGTPNQSRTLFVNAAGVTLGNVGPDGGVALRRDTATTTWSMNNRAQSQGATGAFGSSPTQLASVIGRHVAVGWLTEGLTHTQSMIDGGADGVAAPMTAGAGMPKSRLGINNVATSEKGVVAYLFRGTHSRETRLRVVAWLARKYNTPVPAGY